MKHHHIIPRVAIAFVKGGPDRKAVIASLEKALLAIKGENGTLIYND